MIKLAYILAASHSGSTLLSMLLGSHPQIATVGEIKLSRRAIGDLGRYRCSCGELIQECGFWREVAKGMNRCGFAFDIANAGTNCREVNSRYARRLLAPMVRGSAFESLRDAALWFSPTWHQHLPAVHKRNAALAAVVCEITKAKIVVDSSKIGLRLKYLLRNPELDVRVIRLIRDGRAVALTYMDPATFADAKDPGKRAGGMGGDRAKERLSMAQAAHIWRRSMEESEHLLRGMDPSRWIEVRYEDYCRNPDVVLSLLHRFLGVDPGRQPQDFRAVEQHVVGNGMRLDTTSRVELDERWREELAEGDLRVFDQVSGEIKGRYGYV